MRYLIFHDFPNLSSPLCVDFATVVGYLVVSRPFLNLGNPRHLHTSHSERMLVRNNSLIIVLCICLSVCLSLILLNKEETITY